MEVTGEMVLFKKFKEIFPGSKFSNCRVPTNIYNTIQQRDEGPFRVYAWRLISRQQKMTKRS